MSINVHERDSRKRPFVEQAGRTQGEIAPGILDVDPAFDGGAGAPYVARS